MFQLIPRRPGFAALLLAHAALFILPGIARSETPNA